MCVLGGRGWDGLRAGLTPTRGHYNLNNAAVKQFVDVAFFLCPWSIFFKVELLGLRVGTVHDLSLDDVSWAMLRTGEEIRVLGNTGLATLKKLFLFSTICILSHCLFSPSESTLFIFHFCFLDFLLLVVLFCLFVLSFQ